MTELFASFEDWADAQRGPADPMEEWRAVMRQDHADPYADELPEEWLTEQPEAPVPDADYAEWYATEVEVPGWDEVPF